MKNNWTDKEKLVFWSLIIIKVSFHLITNTTYGFHRDELLFLACGRNPAFGYWSIPPLLGFISFLWQSVFGDGLFAIRLIPMLFGTATLAITCLMAKALGGSWKSMLLAGCGILFATIYLRTSLLFQPVSIDIFFWTLASYQVILWIKSPSRKRMLWLGVILGLGLLNKYSVMFFILPLLAALLLGSHRKIFLKPGIYLAAGIAFVIMLPNIIWQWQYHFPVLHHMQELAATQLVNVEAKDFLLEQLLILLPVTLTWIPGLLWFYASEQGRKFRLVGLLPLFTILLILFLGGKSYYTAGIYPIAIAGGGVFWESISAKGYLRIIPYVLVLLMALTLYPMLPISATILSPEKLEHYCQSFMDKTGVDAHVRWEDGEIHRIPQDFADMIGWEDLAALIDSLANGLPEDSLYILAENYGIAGAVERFSAMRSPKVISFSDNYLFWAPTKIPIETRYIIYLGDIPGTTASQLGRLIKQSTFEHAFARESGLEIYLFDTPDPQFFISYQEYYQSQWDR